MIDQQHGHRIVACDSCDATFTSDKGEDWDSFWSRAKGEGWKAKKIGQAWVHACPDCEVEE